MTEPFYARAFVVLTLAAALVSAWPRTAQSEASVEDQTRARQLFDQGVEAARAEDFDAAIEAFEESYELYPHPGTLLNLGLYQLRADRSVDAYETLRDLMARYRTVLSDRARSEVDQRLQELQAVLAIVIVTSRPLGATIFIDGEEHGQTPLDSTLAYEQGSYTFEARLDGWIPASITRELSAGETTNIELALSPEIPEVQPPPVLVVRSRTESARISIDGDLFEPLPLQRELEPGDHEITIEAEGYATQTRTVTMPAVGEVDLEVDLVRLGAVDRNGEPRRPLWRRPWMWVVGSLVVIGIGTAIAVPLATNREPEPDWTMRVR